MLGLNLILVFIPLFKDKGPQTAKIAGLELPHHALGPHARAKFNKDLLEAEAMNYIKKQQALHRPMSPHLTIYAPQWTWLLSISHRVTGVMLTTSLYGLGIGKVDEIRLI